MERYLKYCLIKGYMDIWPDLRASNSGRPQTYKEFFNIVQEVIEEISGSHPYRCTSKKYLYADDKDLVSVSALHARVSERMKSKNKDPGIQTEIPSEQLPWISMYLQYKSRTVLKHY